MFWVLCAALALVVGAAVLVPFMRRETGEAPAAAYDLQVYRDQLREVDRDLERGVIGAEDAARLRTEIGRKVLDADRALRVARPGQSAGAVLGAAFAVAATLAVSFGLYAYIGSPDQPDQPLKARVTAARALYDTRPSQAEAEAIAAPLLAAREKPQPDQHYMDLIEKLRAAVEKRPDDVEGLALLADHEARLGNAMAAKAAQQHLMALKGDQVSAGDHARMASILIEAAGGAVSPEAEAELVQALKLDPENGPARYLAGLMEAQYGRPDRAFPLWRDLLENSPPDAPWNRSIRMVIGELAWLAGNPGYRPPELAPATMPGPSAEQMQAAQDMDPEAQQDMIRGMVEGLETRLAQEGGTPEEWAMLITSLARLGTTDRAQAILDEARTRFAQAPEALAMLNDAAARAGLQ